MPFDLKKEKEIQFIPIIQFYSIIFWLKSYNTFIISIFTTKVFDFAYSHESKQIWEYAKWTHS